MSKYQQYTNFDLKCSLAAIYQINKMLLKNFKLINMLTKEENIQEKDPICLNLGSLLSNIKQFFCSSFKNSIC